MNQGILPLDPPISIELTVNRDGEKIGEKEEKKEESRGDKKIKRSSFEVHVCVPCKRLFRSLGTMLKHKSDSLLHIKVNLLDNSQTTYDLEQKKVKEENW